MSSPRTTVPWRAPGKLFLAIALVLVLFVSALASASPSLHRWLHKDHQAPSHYCLVTVLVHGQTDLAIIWVAVLPSTAEVPVSALPSESFFVSHDTKLYPERGPPVFS